MALHYFLQGIFVLTGIIALLAALFNWEWFFTARNARSIVGTTDRQRARLFYGFLGIILIGMGIFFFIKVQSLVHA